MLERTERVAINFTVNKSVIDTQRADVQLFLDRLNPVDLESVIDGDELRLDYQFNIEYFGRIVERFQALRRLIANPEVVIRVSHTEMFHGECLIEQVLVELRGIEMYLRMREERADGKGSTAL